MSEESPAGTRSRYRLPPEPIPTIVDAPPTPALLLSPDRRWLAWLGRRGLPPLAELAEPELRAAWVKAHQSDSDPVSWDEVRGSARAGFDLARTQS
mgnify:CR=1 FL=1